MKHDLDTALDQCLLWLREGMSIEQCLARTPEYAGELRPLLKLAVDVGRTLPPVSSAVARAAGEERMLAALAAKRARQERAHPLARLARRLLWGLVPGRPGSRRLAWPASAAVLLVVLMAGGGMVVAASAGSLPGEPLYAVKLAGQQAQLALTANPARLQQLAERFDAQRRLDVAAALQAGRRATVEFSGAIQLIEGDVWLVGGLPVVAGEGTEIVGKPYPGARVQVRGELPGNGQIAASRLVVEPQPAPMPTPSPTATASPTATRQPARTPTARPTQTPTAEERPEPTRTPEPSATPAPTETPEPTGSPQGAGPERSGREPEQEDAPEGTGAPEATGTREAADEPEHEHTPEAGESPEPDDPERSGDEPEHEHTPEGGESPEPDAPPEHEDTPEPTGSPEHERVPEHTGAPEPAGSPEPGEGPGHEATAHPTGEPDD